jgi:hypothetical protein
MHARLEDTDLGSAKQVGDTCSRAPHVGLDQHYVAFRRFSVVSPWTIKGRHLDQIKGDHFTVH